MAIQRLTVTVELPDDTFLPPTRVLHADRKRAAEVARKNGWTEETHPLDLLSFIAWAATKRAGHQSDTFKQFDDRLVEVHQDIEEVDPTKQATSKGSTSS